MKTWNEEKLGKLIKIKHGFAFKGEFFSDLGNFVLLTPGNIYPTGGIKLKGEKEKYYLGEIPNDYLMKKGDLLVVMTDLTQTASILGGAFVIPEDDKYLHNQRLGLVTIKNNEELDKNFLYCYLNWQYFRDQVKASSNGATVKHTSPDRIYKCKINLPSLPIQQKIAAILSAYSDLIENNNKRIALLEKAAGEIYQEWFVRMRFPGWDKTKFVKGIPEGWEIGNFTDFIDVLSGGTPKTDIPQYWGDDIPWFTPRDFHDSFFISDTERRITEEGLKHCASKLYPPNTVFITARGTVGNCVMNVVPMAMSQTSYALQGKKDLHQYFVFYLTLSMVASLKQQATGAVFDTIIVDTFRKQRVIIPSKPIVESFTGLVSPMLDQLKTFQQKNERLKQSRDLLLSRLISGKLPVEGLDIRFPPSMQAEVLKG